MSELAVQMNTHPNTSFQNEPFVIIDEAPQKTIQLEMQGSTMTASMQMPEFMQTPQDNSNGEFAQEDYNFLQEAWTENIYREVTKGANNYLIVVTGRKGSGKSTASISLAQGISKKFGRDFDMDNFCYDAMKFMQTILKFRDVAEDESSRDVKGLVIVVDEMQTIANRRDFYSQVNKGLNLLFSTFRPMGLIVILTTPVLDFIEKQIQPHIDAWFVTMSLDKNTRLTKIRAYLLSYNEFAKNDKEKLRKRFLSVYDKETNQSYEIADIYVTIPSEAIRKQYKKIRDDITKFAINKSMSMISSQQAKEQKQNNYAEALTQTQLKIMQLKLSGKTRDDIAQETGLSKQRLSDVIRALKRKNFGGMLEQLPQASQTAVSKPV